MRFIHSFSSRFLLAFVAIIVLTTLAAGVPAFISIRTELDRQAWARVSDGGRFTMALLEAEKVRLANLAVLVSQRPTLRELVQRGDSDALNQYLRTFKENVDLDLLMLSDESGQVLAKGSEFLPLEVITVLQEASFNVLQSKQPQLTILASEPVPGYSAHALSITVGLILDDAYAENLARETGFEHSFLVGEQIMSSSLEHPPALGTMILPIRRAMESGSTEAVKCNFEDCHYYAALVPILDQHGAVIGLSQIILPIENLLAANRTAMLVLLISTVLSTLAAYGLATYFSQRLTIPIRDLTEAARQISDGDLSKPVTVPDSPSEIASLANALEISRNTILTTMNKLSNSNVWFETLIQSIVEGIITMDGQGRVTLFNQGAEQITGWKAAEVLNMSINQVLPLVEGNGDFIQQLPVSGGVKQVNVRTRQRGEIALAVTCAPIQPSQLESNQMALVIRDISQEEAVRRMSSYFLANITHEFRTPLAALNASVELLLETLEELSVAEIAELLNSISLSVSGLQTLIDNLLESTSIEAGRFQIRCSPTDLGQVVTNALQVMKPLLERRRQNLSLSIPTQMSMVNADSTRLAQVLVNLLSNASKYSPMESTIELSLKIEEPGNLRGTVSDQGCSVPQVERSRLFRPFMRLGDADNTQFSIGLGLSVVKAIVEAHRGEVGMQDRPGGGSIFWFTIPLLEAP